MSPAIRDGTPADHAAILALNLASEHLLGPMDARRFRADRWEHSRWTRQLHNEYADWFGERWWMLPNPSYGSWEPAVFNNAWTDPRDQRRQAKRDALDVAN